MESRTTLVTRSRAADQRLPLEFNCKHVQASIIHEFLHAHIPHPGNGSVPHILESFSTPFELVTEAEA